MNAGGYKSASIALHKPGVGPSYRLFYASNPSGAFCAALCAGYETKTGSRDVLILQSDFYTGNNLEEYELVMRSLASGHDWAKEGFCNGISRTLEYARRRAPFKSKCARRLADIRDARYAHRWIRNLFVATDPQLAEERDLPIDEIWVDMPTYLAIVIIAKYKRAKKVLFPHTPAVFWGTDTPFFVTVSDTAIESPRLKRILERVLMALLPVGLAPKFTKILFEKAYTFRDEKYLAPEVVHLPRSLIRGSLREAYDRLPSDAQTYFRKIGLSNEQTGPPSILFLPTGGERADDFAAELAALSHLLNTTAAVRGSGPIILKPHPRGNETHFRRLCEELHERFPNADFRLVDQWASVPIEIAASTWKVSCCLGLVTNALVSMNWFFDVPGYCPIDLLYEMYAGDQVWTREMDNFLRGDGRFLRPV